MSYRIQADNPFGMNYDLTFEDKGQAQRQVAHITARGAENITINGIPFGERR